MADRLLHRGPDDGGTWCDDNVGIALGHRRLSIVDLSPAGHQPMLSASGRYVAVYNGEIYNHQELRAAIEARGAVQWRGHSDTEVLLAAIDLWGLQAALERSVGMFAIGLWDREQRCLQMARDRIGEKPLYYGKVHGKFVFASELKAIRAVALAPALDRTALQIYLRLGYVPAPFCIYEGLHKVEPGCIVTIKSAGGTAETTRYWSALEAARRGQAQRNDASEAELVDELDRLLRQSIRGQMVADVPVGAFLSGGIDSSTVAAIMQDESSSRVHSYSIGFAESEYDEAPHAKRIAQHLGTDHTELYVTPREAMDVIPRLPEMYDEPFADSSQIPTFLLCQLARRSVTVALSGDGGDELFGGYPRYALADRRWQALQHVPAALRPPAAGLLQAGSTALGVVRHGVGNAPLFGAAITNIADKAQKAARLLRTTSVEEVYARLVATWPDAAQAMPADGAPAWVEQAMRSAGGSPFERMMFADLVTYLPDDVLAKVDRASMAASLETRVPLLDHRVVEFSFRVAPRLNKPVDSSKWLLRQLLGSYVPPKSFERPKMGFGVPIDRWLQGALNSWAHDLLQPTALANLGIEPSHVLQMWQDHCFGKKRHHIALWSILTLLAWTRLSPSEPTFL